MNKIMDAITRFFPRRTREILRDDYICSYGAFDVTKRTFSNLIWYNICDILIDLLEDVAIEITAKDDDNVYFAAAYKAFVYYYGRMVLQRLYDDGFVVIGYSNDRTKFWVMQQNEYTTKRVKNEDSDYIDVTTATPKEAGVQLYVMRSQSFMTYGKSDKALCKAWLDYVDDIFNGSATVSRRLGALVVASPKNLTNAPTAVNLSPEQKKDLEKQFQDQYGNLSSQKNVCFLPREMSWQVINLAGLDLKTQEKAKTAILAIADRIKVPSNQVAMIDANSSKTLANGSELREGDKAKYKSFRRVYERTFMQMALDLRVQVTYILTGEPIDKQQTQL